MNNVVGNGSVTLTIGLLARQHVRARLLVDGVHQRANPFWWHRHAAERAEFEYGEEKHSTKP